jgi:hypothetical protein
MSTNEPIGVRVDENTWLEFRDYVLGRYHRLYGILGIEVTQALDEYLENHSIKRGIGNASFSKRMKDYFQTKPYKSRVKAKKVYKKR